MKKYPRAAVLVLTATMIFGSGRLAAGQNQPGGGTLPREAVGGATLIFRRPEDPNAQTVGGGRISGRVRTRVAAAAQDKIIAKGNAARSASRPRYSEAEEEYKLAARQDPKDARAHAGLGNVYLDQGRFSDAAGAYSQAIKVKADYLPAYQPLGYSLARLNRYAEAVEILKEALRYDPNNAEIYNNLGFAYVHAERYAEAVEACLQAIKLLGQTGEAFKQGLQNRNEVLSHAYKNLGNAYNGLRQYNDAAEALRHATEIEPTNASAHFNLGLALYNGGRHSEAIEAYKAVVKLRPELAGAHYNLGLAYVAINDNEAARREYNILKPLNAAMAAQLQSVIKK